jgi:hypothetical protein
MTAAPADLNWAGKADLLAFGSHVGPALAAVPEYSEVALWYAFEGPP